MTPIVDAAGGPPSGGLSSIQFACDGTLFGGTAKDNEAPDGGFLVTLNTVTGIFSFVRPAPAAPQQSLGALAFEETCPARGIPTLPTWGLIGFALLLLASLPGAVQEGEGAQAPVPLVGQAEIALTRPSPVWTRPRSPLHYQ